MNGRAPLASLLLVSALLCSPLPLYSSPSLWGDPVDVSEHFRRLEQVYFIADHVTDFDSETGDGTLQWNRHRLSTALSFNKVDLAYERAEATEFPGTEYDRDPSLPFSVSFVGPRTARVRFSTRSVSLPDTASPMLDGPLEPDDSWVARDDGSVVTWTGTHGVVRLTRAPFQIAFLDVDGELLTRTRALGDPATFSTPVPFSFVRRADDMGRSTAASFELAHDEKLYGTGESFTRLDKRGQKVVLFIRDAMGAQTRHMYKPIPFFLSSRGYGVFTHTSAPVTFDFGHDFDATNVVYSGDEFVDLFFFFGEPKDVLPAYTAITGRSPMPPLWSFGFWMSRITYSSEAEVREIAARLRERRVPADVIHIDTGWFETDWRNDYRFAPDRFPDPQGMVRDLRDQGFHVSLWQLPYFTRKNRLFPEILELGLHVRNESGTLPDLDATLDFSNAGTISWYQARLQDLFDTGVSVIKADFGEGAPLAGIYASGRSGWYEHNLYPVRYNDAVFEATRAATGEGIIWGRSAWAGSQRYPLHWGGDAENTDAAMAATLRAGLSLGLSGFTFWSHDIGGFVEKAPRDLYRRWLPFGALTSHTRAHGAPPREPWEYDDEMVVEFRRALGLKYALMPYLYTQATIASAHGHPMLRTLFFEFPDDPTSWLIEDQYMLGSDLLVAPLFTEGEDRLVYLPPGIWFDYQSQRAYEGERWHRIEAGEIPIVLLVRDHSVLPHVEVAQHTGAIDWRKIELRVFSSDRSQVEGALATPSSDLHDLTLEHGNDGYRLTETPLIGVDWTIRAISTR
jgi:alpha-D-xyloside xylohydrolase